MPWGHDVIHGETQWWSLLDTPCEQTITPRLWIIDFVLYRFENRFGNLQNIFSKWSNRNVFSFNLNTFACIDWNDDTSTSTCVYVKSVIRDGDVEIYSQLSLKNTQKLDMLYTSLLKCICIIFTNQNTHNIFYYKTLGNITFEICNLRGHTCIYHQHETSEALHQRSRRRPHNHHHNWHSIKSGWNQHPFQPFDEGLWLPARPCSRFPFSTVALSLHPKGKNRATLASADHSCTEQHVLLECSPTRTDSALWNLHLKSRPDRGEAVISVWTENKQNKPRSNSRLITNYLVYKNMCPK